MIKPTINESDLITAAAEGMDAFVSVFYDATMKVIGGTLTPEAMSQLSADQITLLAYIMFRDEVMDGGFIQLIHNGYGPFIFENPFAKAMKQWGATEFAKILYDGRRLYDLHRDEIIRDCSDDEFMAMFESYPDFDNLDDAFVEMEEQVTTLVAEYIDNNIDHFVIIEK